MIIKTVSLLTCGRVVAGVICQYGDGGGRDANAAVLGGPPGAVELDRPAYVVPPHDRLAPGPRRLANRLARRDRSLVVGGEQRQQTRMTATSKSARFGACTDVI